jgi:hypothetical protein
LPCGTQTSFPVPPLSVPIEPRAVPSVSLSVPPRRVKEVPLPATTSLPPPRRRQCLSPTQGHHDQRHRRRFQDRPRPQDHRQYPRLCHARRALYHASDRKQRKDGNHARAGKEQRPDPERPRQHLRSAGMLRFPSEPAPNDRDRIGNSGDVPVLARSYGGLMPKAAVPHRTADAERTRR